MGPVSLTFVGEAGPRPFFAFCYFLYMGVHRHTLTEKDFKSLTAVCAIDGPVELKVYGNTYSCIEAYRASNRKNRVDRKTHAYRKKKGTTCDRCGFVAEHRTQLDVDHINGDRTDDRDENLQTLCANCHRLKTYAPELL